jgi:micrococcal nuclease
LKKDLIPVPGRKYLTTERNNLHGSLFSLVLIPVIIICACACGLFYEYPAGNMEIEADVENHMVPEVVDGDTIILENGDRIRLLGINTPEEGMYFYQESKQVLQAMILEKEVILKKDVTDLDLYGRKLRYVFKGNIFVNLEMVKRGFANIYTYPPDVRYAGEFLEAERYARKNNLGLWELSDLDMVSIDIVYDAPGNDNENPEGEYVILENTGSDVLDTAGWTIKDSGTSIYRFGSYKFYPGSRIILYSGRGEDSEGIFYWNSSRPVWNNDFDTVYLRDAEGLLINIYNY